MYVYVLIPWNDFCMWMLYGDIEMFKYIFSTKISFVVCCLWFALYTFCIYNIDRLMQERRNSIASALELRLYCTNPSIYVSNHICDHCNKDIPVHDWHNIRIREFRRCGIWQYKVLSINPTHWTVIKDAFTLRLRPNPQWSNPTCCLCYPVNTMPADALAT